MLAIGSYPDRAETATFIGLQRSGVEVYAMCEPTAEALGRFREAGIRAEGLSIRFAYDLRAIRRIRSTLRDVSPHVLHVTTRRALRQSLVASFGFDLAIVAYRGVVGGASSPWDPGNWVTFRHPRVDRIVCVSERVRRSLVGPEAGAFPLDARRAVTIHKGHDVEWYDSPPADLGEFGVPAGTFVVSCVANLRGAGGPRTGKGIEHLVRAADYLPDRPTPDGHARKNVRFLLVGDGMDGPGVRRRVNETRRPEAFHLAGYREDAPRLVAASDCLVQPSLSEGLSKVVIESMACRTVPIVTAAGGGELVEDGVSGIVVPAEDAAGIARAIARLAADPKRLRRMGEAARRRIREEFSLEETVRRTRELYDELVESSN